MEWEVSRIDERRKTQGRTMDYAKVLGLGVPNRVQVLVEFLEYRFGPS